VASARRVTNQLFNAPVEAKIERACQFHARKAEQQVEHHQRLRERQAPWSRSPCPSTGHAQDKPRAAAGPRIRPSVGETKARQHAAQRHRARDLHALDPAETHRSSARRRPTAPPPPGPGARIPQADAAQHDPNRRRRTAGAARAGGEEEGGRHRWCPFRLLAMIGVGSKASGSSARAKRRRPYETRGIEWFHGMGSAYATTLLQACQAQRCARLNTCAP